MSTYDLIIAGAGPAGITAAVYAARKKLKTLVLTENIGGQAALSGDIENYTGYQFISGMDLAKKFEEHMKTFDVELKEGVEASSIEKKGEEFVVKAGEEEYTSRTVILATGGKPRLLNVPGEKTFKNKGVTYCATCDAPLFAGKDVAVIGGGNSALDATLQLMEIADKIYLVTVNDDMAGETVLIDKVKASDKVELLANARTKEILGETFVNQLKVAVDGEERVIDVQGVFIEIGWVPAPPAVGGEGGELQVNDWNEIMVNERCETGIPGLFAAGDVTNVPEKQIIVAAGQGCIASLSASKYLSGKHFKEE